MELINELLIKRGFKKNKNHWFLTNNFVTLVIECQKSRFKSGAFFLNFGVYFAHDSLNIKNIRIDDCYLVLRLNNLLNSREPEDIWLNQEELTEEQRLKIQGAIDVFLTFLDVTVIVKVLNAEIVFDGLMIQKKTEGELLMMLLG